MRIVWLVTTFVITLTVIAAAPAENSNKCKTCMSDGCKRASEEVLKLIDTSVDPCDDFYNFACGGFMKHNEIPDDKIEIGKLADITNVVSTQIHSLLKEPISDKEPKSTQLLKKFFQVCMDINTINKNELKTAKLLLKEIGGWPLVEGDDWKENDWKEIMYKFRKSGLGTSQLIVIKVEPSAKNSSQRIITVAQTESPLSSDGLKKGLEDKNTNAYYNYIVDLAVFFGANKDRASAELKTTIEFMMELGKIIIPPEQLRDLSATTNIMTVTELQEKFPSINWVEYLNNIFAIPNIKITENDMVDVGMPKYVTDLEALLKKTPKRVLANFLITREMASIVNTLPQEVKDRQDALIKDTVGTSAEPRWKDCLAIGTERLKIATASIYARKYFTKDAKNNMKKLVSGLHNKFLDMLKGVGWMDDKTKNEALAKAKTIEEHIAYPEQLLDDEVMNNYYKDLDISDDYLQFTLSIDKFTLDEMYKSYKHPASRNDWKEHSVSHQVNAFYHLSENSIIIPAGILQGAMFQNDRPNYMNYGGIGFVIGHELTHGFDDKGKQISKEGQLENWWSKETEEAYKKKADCIMYQYGNFSHEKLKASVNGIITLGENIADNGGFKLAYDAYQEAVKTNGPEECLPNLDYTPNQMFWISLANAWCTKSRDDRFRVEILTSDHSPAMYRIYGVAQNSEVFAKDFNCPANTKMNPENKCSFW